MDYVFQAFGPDTVKDLCLWVIDIWNTNNEIMMNEAVKEMCQNNIWNMQMWTWSDNVSMVGANFKY